jgi:hypothetical protein
MRFLPFVFSLLLLPALVSEGARAQGSAESEWLSADPVSGLITLLPKPEIGALIDQLRGFKARLRAREGRLRRYAESKSLGVKDGLVAAVMPGGLLYAVFRNHEHQRAVDRADAAAEELDAIGLDITRLQAGAGASLVALADPASASP